MRKTKIDVQQSLTTHHIVVTGPRADHNLDNTIQSNPPTDLPVVSLEYYLRYVHDHVEIEGIKMSNDKTEYTITKTNAVRKLFIANTERHIGSTSLNPNSYTPYGPRVVSYAASQILFHENQNEIPDITNDDYEVEGYASDADNTSLYSSPKLDDNEFTREGYIFDNALNKMVIHLGCLLISSSCRSVFCTRRI